MALRKREQRIRLRVDGSPIPMDATILTISPDAQSLTVRWDHPDWEDTTLYVLRGGAKILTDRMAVDGTRIKLLPGDARLFHVV